MPFGTTLHYQGYTLKSKTEFTWARYYLMQGFDWKYEPVKFRDPNAPEGKGYSYTPDFGLDGNEIFTEIKVLGARNLDNRFHFCTKPLILIFGTPEKHYCHFKPAGATSFLTRHIQAFAQAYDLARKAI